MSSSIATEKSQALSESQRTALIKLLADEDPAVYHLVRKKILSYGQTAILWMQPHVLSGDPVLRRRAQEINDHLGRQSADNRFLETVINGVFDANPAMIPENVKTPAQIAVWYEERFAKNFDALTKLNGEQLTKMVDFRGMFQRPAVSFVMLGLHHTIHHLGFRGNEENYYEPENSYLNRVIDRRTGNPISLCMVYLFLSRRLHLPVTGIGMPGHFLCRFQCSTDELYIDAFNRGKLLTKNDCVKYLVQTSYGYQEGLLTPATPRRILLRMCSTLHQIYLHLKLPDETARLQRYIVALAK